MSLQKYLRHYAEPETQLTGDFPQTYGHVLCIPAYVEEGRFLSGLLSRISTGSLLLIVVVNSPADASEEYLRKTRELADSLRRSGELRREFADHMRLLAFDPNRGHDLLLVEKFALPEKAGVGLARKIACDIACRLIDMGCIDTPWIHSTDADARLPAEYFSAAAGLDAGSDSAGIYPFRHIASGDSGLDGTQQLYDASMHYYVAGLKWAGSPWAYHTLGSTLVLNARHYAQVRGFPRRRAAEDFYLLNKLSKTGAIVTLDTNPVMLESRLSDRVPFGTGPALRKILEMENPVKNFLFYAPECFVYLKCWLQVSRSLWETNRPKITKPDIDNTKAGKAEFKEIESDVLLECLTALGVEKALDHAFTHSKSESVFLKHLDNWFDGFQTLKFIHWLRDNHCPSVPLKSIKVEQALAFTETVKGP